MSNENLTHNAPLFLKVFLSLLMIFLFLELTARFFVVPSDNIFISEPTLGWKFIPEKAGTFYNGHFWRQYKFNREGFLDNEYTIEKKSTRVATIGDSFIEGLSVHQNETMQSVLEEKLNAHTEVNRSYEVINFGVGSYGTLQEYLALREYGLKYKPDFVLLGFYMNDYDDNFYAFTKYKERPYANFSSGTLKINPPTSPLNTPPFALFVSEYFKSAVLLRQIFLKITSPEKTVAGFDFGKYMSPYHKNYTNLNDEAWNTTLNIITEIKTISEANNATLIVVIIPNSFELYNEDYNALLKELEFYNFSIDDIDLNKPRAVLTTFLMDNNISFVNVYELCKNNIAEKCYYDFPKDVHWNNFGNSLVAENLTDFILTHK